MIPFLQKKTIEFLKKKHIDHIGKANKNKGKFVIKPISWSWIIDSKNIQKYSFKKTEIIQIIFPV